MQTHPYEILFWEMLETAQQLQASDIHIQPDQEGVHLRFRVFGDLTLWKWIAAPHKIPFLQEAKRLSHCSLAASGRAQDARFSVKTLKLDVRVNLIPSLHGEKIVLRLLDQNRSFALDSMGLETEATRTLQATLQLKTGVALITGPTGSGKTTLLYAALASLNQSRLNIVTIEDPVEYYFPGLTQVAVSSKLSMPEALKAILRQDPDVILLGEVRDAESAALCFQAASTGHFVLSSLHANNAKEVPQRLSGLGVHPDLLSSCLRFTSAQRLLAKLCPFCKQAITGSDAEQDEGPKLPRLPDHPSGSWYQRTQKGCQHCYSGVTGRVPVLEFLTFRAAEPPFSSPLLQAGALKAAQKGEVDVYEALAIE